MRLVLAKETEKKEILALYRSVIGSEGCTWSLDYPNEEILEDDFSRAALFVMKEKEEILGAVSIDEDKAVEGLDCWSKELVPGAELARLVVKEGYQNQGIARRMLRDMMVELRDRGYQSVHFLVSKMNERALRSYARLHFSKKGEAALFGEQWWCYEKELCRKEREDGETELEPVDSFIK